METWMIILISIAIVAVLYVLMSLVVVKADEKAVIFIFGKAARVIGPGLRFCPWLFSLKLLGMVWNL